MNKSITRDPAETLEYADKMYRRNVEYAERRREKAEMLSPTPNFTPHINKTPKYKIDNDIITRNKAFEEKRTKKLKDRQDAENTSYSFKPTLHTSKYSTSAAQQITTDEGAS